ncbi:MAG: hypothetical protein PHP08_04180 [Candidatus Dojkabacteria bacterium]|nr:hypothetical protein [Candidatus Dojkabacteria bacterium]
MEKSQILNSLEKIKNQLYCVIFTGSFFSSPDSGNWKDIDIIIVTKKNSIILQKNISDIFQKLKSISIADISVDIIQKEDVTNPSNILKLHTKVANAIYEANYNVSRITFFDSKEEIYKLTKKDIRVYSKTAVRELFQEAHKDISRNLSVILKDKKKEILKKYIKRIFNIIKMSIIFKTEEIPQTKKDAIKIAKEIFNYDFSKIEYYIEIIDVWPNINKDEYKDLMLQLINEIYSFYKYLEKHENIL